MKTSIFSLILVVITLTAQNTFGQATLRVRPNFQHGDLVVSSSGRFEGDLAISNEANSDMVIGVYNEISDFKNGLNILTSGIAYVKFDHSNGEVVRGDRISSSSNAGKGMKANSNCMTIGVALESSTPGTELLKILVQPSWSKPAN